MRASVFIPIPLFACALFGCQEFEPATNMPTMQQKQTTTFVPQPFPEKYIYQVCDKEKAATILTLLVEDRDGQLINRQRIPLRIRKVTAFDDGWWAGGFSGCGGRGGLNGSISLRNSSDCSLDIHYSLAWRFLNDVRGRFDERLNIEIGQVGSKLIDDGVTISWEFDDRVSTNPKDPVLRDLVEAVHAYGLNES